MLLGTKHIRNQMQKIEYRKGNLLNVTSGIIAHGCNAQGVMGSGVAKGIREKFPTAYRYYRDQYTSGYQSSLGLGDVQIVSVVPKTLYVANLITQEFYGTSGNRYVSYDAVDECFDNLFARNIPKQIVNIPKIGAGLGGGDWSVIESIIESRMQQYKDQVVICWEL